MKSSKSFAELCRNILNASSETVPAAVNEEAQHTKPNQILGTPLTLFYSDSNNSLLNHSLFKYFVGLSTALVDFLAISFIRFNKLNIPIIELPIIIYCICLLHTFYFATYF